MRAKTVVLGTLSAMLTLNGCAAPPCDLVIVNARVWTGCPNTPEAEAVGVRGERIALVGASAEVQAHIGPNTLVIDAGGRRVIPGLVDCHTHIIGAGLQLDRLHLRDVADRDEFVSAITAAAQEKQPGQWLLGGRWSVESWPNPESPTKAWIDEATGEVPVFLVRMDGHQALVNSVALKIAGIDASGPADPPGGEIERHAATGEPTGILKDDAMALVRDHIPEISNEDREAALLRAMRHANRLGITGVHDMSEPADLPCFLRVRDSGRATVRIRSFVMDDAWSPHFETVRRFANDDWVTVGGVKGFMDGSLGSRTAFMHEPYADAEPEEKYPRGLLVAMADPPDKLRAQIAEADGRGAQVVIHAIGDRANSMLLNHYEAVARDHPGRDRRHRIEHAQHLKPQDIPRFAKLGVVASMQPYHKADDARYVDEAIGPERAKTSYAYRSLLDAGALLCFGSDWPVVDVNPFKGIASAVTARSLDGEVWHPEQSITVAEALRAYTTDAARAGFAEDTLGTIEQGKLADMIILDRDPFTVDPAEIDKMLVTHTIIGGRVVWAAD